METGDNHLLETIKRVLLVHPHRAGWPFIAGFAIVSVILALLWAPLGWIGLVLTLWCVYFFRDPERVTPTRAGVVVSPADGMVQKISQLVPPPELDLGTELHTRISIFLNVFDVHVNRMPVAGIVRKMHYHAGLFLNASLDKASTDNERQLLSVDMADGTRVGVIQIAGLVARRILCDAREGQSYAAGERFGIIRFGSRTDVYLPLSADVLVLEGQKAVGGETVIAMLKTTPGAVAAPTIGALDDLPPVTL